MRPLTAHRLLPYLTDGPGFGAAALAVGALTALFTSVLGVTDPTIVALSFLLIVLVIAAVSSWRVAVATSLMAFLSFNFFFLPPTGHAADCRCAALGRSVHAAVRQSGRQLPVV